MGPGPGTGMQAQLCWHSKCITEEEAPELGAEDCEEVTLVVED